MSGSSAPKWTPPVKTAGAGPGTTGAATEKPASKWGVPGAAPKAAPETAGAAGGGDAPAKPASKWGLPGAKAASSAGGAVAPSATTPRAAFGAAAKTGAAGAGASAGGGGDAFASAVARERELTPGEWSPHGPASPGDALWLSCADGVGVRAAVVKAVTVGSVTGTGTVTVASADGSDEVLATIPRRAAVGTQRIGAGEGGAGGGGGGGAATSAGPPIWLRATGTSPPANDADIAAALVAGGGAGAPLVLGPVSSIPHGAADTRVAVHAITTAPLSETAGPFSAFLLAPPASSTSAFMMVRDAGEGGARSTTTSLAITAAHHVDPTGAVAAAIKIVAPLFCGGGSALIAVGGDAAPSLFVVDTPSAARMETPSLLEDMANAAVLRGRGGGESAAVAVADLLTAAVRDGVLAELPAAPPSAAPPSLLPQKGAHA